MSLIAGGENPPPGRDYYAILGLALGARGADVGAAYWRLVRAQDARRPGHGRLLLDLDELNEAAEVLGTPALRREYDKARRAAAAGREPLPAPPAATRRTASARLRRIGILGVLILAAGIVTSPAATRARAAIPGAPVTAASIVFLGDSVTYGAGATSPAQSYVQVLERRLADAGAASGPTDFDSVISALGGQAVDLRFSQDIGSAPRSLIVVEVGAHSVVEDEHLSAQAFARGYGLMLDCLEGTGAEVVVSTVPWLGWTRSDPFYARAEQRSAIIRVEATMRGVPVVDLWSAMRDRRDLLSADAFHPGDSGHLLIANLFWLQVQPLLHKARAVFRDRCNYDDTLALRSSEASTSARSQVAR